MEHQKPDQNKAPVNDLANLDTAELVARLNVLSNAFSQMAQKSQKGNEEQNSQYQEAVTANIKQQKKISDILESRGYTPGV